MDSSTTTYQMPLASLFAMLTLLVGTQALGQVPVDGDGTPVAALTTANEKFSNEAYASDAEPLSAAELEQLVGPVALYPDDLLAIVLPASTYPLQIVQAARFLQAYAVDSSLEPDEDWDESVVALINYPEVIELLNDDIDWTWRLGEAVIDQQEDLVGAVEAFRNRAYAAGNLKSDEYQTISLEDDIIEIVPIEDDVIYVPYYEPERVVVYQSQPVYYYHAQAYPVYYYPYPYGHAFSSGYFWGVTTAFRIGWATDRLHVQHASYWGHPYYGHHYYGHYYRRPSIAAYNTVYVNNARRSTRHHYRDGDYWRPNRHSGARQTDYSSHSRHYRNDVQRVRSSTRTTSARNVRHSTVNTINRQSRSLTTTQTRRNREAIATSLTQRRSDHSNSRATSTRPSSGQVTDRRQNSHRSSSTATRSQPQRRSTNRAEREVRSQQHQARTQASRAQASRPARTERSTVQREKKPARTERSSTRRAEKPAHKSPQGRSSDRDSRRSR